MVDGSKWRFDEVVPGAWCLEHGASVKSPPVDSCRCRRILEKAANSGASIATFELLRSRGVPIGRRTLHRAIETAVFGHNGSEDPEKDTREQRESREKYARYMVMIRHLLDVLRLDVNFPDVAPGDMRGRSSAYRTPLCYVVGIGRPDCDARELTWLLPDRGEDPRPAIILAKEYDHATFIEHVDRSNTEKGYTDYERYNRREKSKRICCVQ